jgi:hypothetical protein
MQILTGARGVRPTWTLGFRIARPTATICISARGRAGTLAFIHTANCTLPPLALALLTLLLLG